MKTDNNTVIGFVLIGILFIGYFWFSNRQQEALFQERKRTEDSIARTKPATAPPADPAIAKLDSLKKDSLNNLTAAGNFQNAANGSEQLTVIENALIKITFSNKGAQPKSVELKKYKSFDSTNVVLAGSAFDNVSYTINTSPNQTSPTSNLFFNPPVIKKDANGRQIITYNLPSPDGQSITHEFIVKLNDYMIDWNIILNGANRLLTGNSMNLNWQVQARQQQSDVTYERNQTRLCYVEDGSYNFNNAATGTTEAFDKHVNWLSV